MKLGVGRGRCWLSSTSKSSKGKKFLGSLERNDSVSFMCIKAINVMVGNVDHMLCNMCLGATSGGNKHHHRPQPLTPNPEQHVSFLRGEHRAPDHVDEWYDRNICPLETETTTTSDTKRQNAQVLHNQVTQPLTQTPVQHGLAIHEVLAPNDVSQ
eukprot:115309-Rhodomonas_salina.1